MGHGAECHRGQRQTQPGGAKIPAPPQSDGHYDGAQPSRAHAEGTQPKGPHTTRVERTALRTPN